MKKETSLFIRFLKDRNQHIVFHNRVKEYLFTISNYDKHYILKKYPNETVYFLDKYNLRPIIRWFKNNNSILAQFMEDEWNNYKEKYI